MERALSWILCICIFLIHVLVSSILNSLQGLLLIYEANFSLVSLLLLWKRGLLNDLIVLILHKVKFLSKTLENNYFNFNKLSWCMFWTNLMCKKKSQTKWMTFTNKVTFRLKPVCNQRCQKHLWNKISLFHRTRKINKHNMC